MDDTITTGRKTEEDSQPRVLISLRNAIMSSRFPKAYASSDWDKSCWQTRRKQSAFSNSHGKLSSSAIPRSIYTRRGSRVERSINYIDGNAGFFHMHVPICTRLRCRVDRDFACKIYSLEHLIERGLLVYSTPSSGAKISFDYKVREELQTRSCWNIRRMSTKRYHANYGLRINHAVLGHHTLSIRV